MSLSEKIVDYRFGDIRFFAYKEEDVKEAVKELKEKTSKTCDCAFNCLENIDEIFGEELSKYNE